LPQTTPVECKTTRYLVVVAVDASFLPLHHPLKIRALVRVMATKRKRTSGTWEYVVKRKLLLKAPLYLSFESEAEGDAYVKKLEALLNKGIVPAEFQNSADAFTTIGDVIRDYLIAQHVASSDRAGLGLLFTRIGPTRLSTVSYSWAESWVTEQKRSLQLSPTTIRHHVGALARCFDWAERRGVSALMPNPLRRLPRNYSTYTAADAVAVRALGGSAKSDVERDRRIQAGEEKRIRGILAGDIGNGRQRPFDLHWQGALECLFELALESAMRMREMFTVSLDQVDIPNKTFFLDKTKNGDKRQVPLTSVALKTLKRYMRQVEKQQRKMKGFSFDGGRLFPWWDGSPESLNKTTASLSQQFSRIFEAAGCEDLRFHDLRHEATSRLFEKTKLTDVQISRITGHKDPRVLRRYANLRGTDLAAQLW
jgi:integrase